MLIKKCRLLIKYQYIKKRSVYCVYYMVVNKMEVQWLKQFNDTISV